MELFLFKNIKLDIDLDQLAYKIYDSLFDILYSDGWTMDECVENPTQLTYMIKDIIRDHIGDLIR